MKTIIVKAQSGQSRVQLGGSIDQLSELAGKRQMLIITDENVHRLHGHRFPVAPVEVLTPGEDGKNLDTVRAIYEKCVALELDRSALVVGVGGGVVCDIAGFVGATFLRGVDFGFVATTVLAQVDASVGGKNGVNLNSYKNLVGTFAQPEFVLLDYDLLSTLPAAERRSGLAEVVKAGAIADPTLFELVAQHRDALLAGDRDALALVTEGAVAVKADVVMKDERESGQRRILNFGHTFGHAVERTSDLMHGEAVSVGMVVAARVSEQKGLLAAADVARLEGLLAGLGLPVRISADGEAAFDAMRKDKKRTGDQIYFVLLEGIGRAVVRPIGLDELKGVVDDLC